MGSNWQFASIGSDNGFAQNRQQAIIWTSDSLVHWSMYASLGLNELNPYSLIAKCVQNDIKPND